MATLRFTRALAALLLGAAVVAAPSGAQAAATNSFSPLTAVGSQPVLLVDQGAPSVDFDGDGHVDSVTSIGGDLTIVFGGPVAGQQSLGRSAARALSGDVNGDGIGDVLPVGLDGFVQTMIPGRGPGPAGGARAEFGADVPVVAGVPNRAQFIVYDTDLDGSDDLIAYDSVGLSGSVLYRGSATAVPFTESFPLAGPVPDSGLARSADLDGDGQVELLLGKLQPGGFTVTVHQRSAAGYSVTGQISYAGSGIRLADANGDGLIDIGAPDGRWAMQVSLPAPVVPESPVVAALGISAAVALAVASAPHRRRARSLARA